MAISNKKKARNLAEYYKNDIAKDRETIVYDAVMLTAQWKDEQHAQEKQQMIEKACEFMRHYILEHEYVDIFEMEDEFRRQMEDYL